MGKPLRVFVREGMRAQGTREIAARQGRQNMGCGNVPITEYDGVDAQRSLQEALRSGWVIEWKGHVIASDIALYHKGLSDRLEVKNANEANTDRV